MTIFTGVQFTAKENIVEKKDIRNKIDSRKLLNCSVGTFYVVKQWNIFIKILTKVMIYQKGLGQVDFYQKR